MDEKRLRIMIERFFDARLGTDEERELYCYLYENDVPEELRKDKEAIIALCSHPTSSATSDEAFTRLEAMIDALETEERTLPVEPRAVQAPKRRIIKIPRPLYRGIAAAAILAVGFFIFTNTRQQTGSVSFATAEEDTFDTPEEALKCVRESFDLVLMAANSTNRSRRAIGTTLEQSIAIHSKREPLNK